MAKGNFLSRLAFFASLFALGVIALGAFTRLVDAGLGCPDWPGCYGHLLVPQEVQPAGYAYPVVAYKAWAEMVHRYFVGALSALIVVIVTVVVSRRAYRTRGNGCLTLLLVSLLVYQALLGKWTVTLKLLPVVVTQHLLGGFFILLTLWLLHISNNLPLRERLPSMAIGNLRHLTVIALILILLQIALGAWTSTNYASLSCPDFPFCMQQQTLHWSFAEAFRLSAPVGINYAGGTLPETARQTIQMVHRVGALVVTCYLFMLITVGMRRLPQAFELQKSLFAILGLLCLQLCLGISNVLFKLPLATALAHNLVAALLLLAIVTLLFKLHVSRQKGVIL